MHGIGFLDSRFGNRVQFRDPVTSKALVIEYVFIYLFLKRVGFPDNRIPAHILAKKFGDKRFLCEFSNFYMP